MRHKCRSSLSVVLLLALLAAAAACGSEGEDEAPPVTKDEAEALYLAVETSQSLATAFDLSLRPARLGGKMNFSNITRSTSAAAGSPPACHPYYRLNSRMFIVKRVLRNMLPDLKKSASFGLITFSQSGYYRYSPAVRGRGEG